MNIINSFIFIFYFFEVIIHMKLWWIVLKERIMDASLILLSQTQMFQISIIILSKMFTIWK